MSGFDEEAERERLREKYERDREKRTATQRMSELLLKGATMTNKHCDACGDPIFNHDGQEFCPTCRAEGGSDPDGSIAADDDGSADPEAEDAAAGTPPAVEAEGDVGDDIRDGTGDDAGTTSPDGTDPSAGGPQRGGGTGRNREQGGPRAGDADAGRDVVDEGTGGQPVGGGSTDRSTPRDDLAAARASLSRTLVGYARAAEETDDPRRATELLGAAREAAETLAALDRR